MSTWRAIQKGNWTRWQPLLAYLELEGAEVRSSFALNLPRRLASKIEKGRWDDPLLLQFLPSAQEEATPLGFVRDPVCDTSFQKGAKLLHKYQGRALLLCTSACAMHCRYCFRRHFDYTLGAHGFEEELSMIRGDESLSEIILSGGDPLSLSNETLGSLLLALDAIPHVQRIRFHTRFPIGIPERIDEELLSLLQRLRAQVVFIIHCNHIREFDEEVFAALRRVQQLGIPVLSQSVLLRGVNDTLSALKDLCAGLVNRAILPYYLHQLDRVQGAAHFEVMPAEGLALIAELQRELPGYAIPRYVKEEPFMPHKVAL